MTAPGLDCPMEIAVLPGMAAFHREAAARVVAAHDVALTRHGRFDLVLAGGSTPAGVYAVLASQFIDRLEWRRTHIFFGDERCVPPDHAWSNYGMAHRTLLQHVPLPPANIHRMAGELSPEVAAGLYAAELAGAELTHAEVSPAVAELAQLAGAACPRFDLVLLGMGDDGHTASLFPGMAALGSQETVVATAVPAYVEPQVGRITLTLPVLNAAHEALVLIAGAGKAPMVRRITAALRFGGADAQLPLAQVKLAAGRLVWLLDEAAAAALGEL